MSQPDSVYDVAISYASEQLGYVEEFNDCVEKKGFTSFFDREKQAQLWGEPLPETLYEVYFRKSKWCVMFISKEYVSKVYPNLERKAIIDRQIRSERYVLPVRFDDSEVPGLSVGIKHVWAKDYTPSKLAALFEERFFTEL
jgi:hypothetical protein